MTNEGEKTMSQSLTRITTTSPDTDADPSSISAPLNRSGRRAMTAKAFVALSLGGATLAGTMPARWDIEFVARSAEGVGQSQFNLWPHSIIEDQHIVIDDLGNIAIRLESAVNEFTDAVYTGPVPLFPGIGFLPAINHFANPLSPDLDLFQGHLAILNPDSIDGGTSGKGSIFLLDAFSGATLENLPTRHPDYPEDTISLAWDDSVGVRTRIGLAGYAINIDSAGPPRETRTLISTLDNGNDPIDFIGPMMSPWTKTFVSVEQPYFETPPGPPRVLVTVAPIEGQPGRERTVIATAQGEIDRLAGYASISANDRIAAISRRAADQTWQIGRYDAPGSATHIADLPHFDASDIDNTAVRPAISSDGIIAYRSPDALGAASLLAGDGVDTVTIVSPGDPIETDLGTLTLGFDHPDGARLLNGRVDINDLNEIAFTAWLSNGSIGIFIATPVLSCNPADLAEPFDVLDLGDLQAFVTAFVGGGSAADLAAPEGVFDLADIQAFVTEFNAGCP